MGVREDRYQLSAPHTDEAWCRIPSARRTISHTMGDPKRQMLGHRRRRRDHQRRIVHSPLGTRPSGFIKGHKPS
jgi:hypothetical protein